MIGIERQGLTAQMSRDVESFIASTVGGRGSAMPAILLALVLAVSLLAPSTVCADEASEKALKLLKKKKIKVPKSGVPVDLSKLKQPQLDPWVMWWMRPYLVPGTQNAPKKKAKLKLMFLLLARKISRTLK